jgi:hypothetical protein
MEEGEEQNSPSLNSFNINNLKFKKNKLIDEKEIITQQYSRAVQDKAIEFNRVEMIAEEVQKNKNEPNTTRKNKKNNFEYNFLEYFLLNTMCCFKKNHKVSKKNILLENSEDFCDYYLDINTYVKKMMEIDLLKLYVIKNKKELDAIENFKPALKSGYSEKYNEKIEKMYSNRVSKDLESFSDSIKNMKTNDDRIFREFLDYYS